jgi:cytosine/adenosine deaminase-related metal-dependent hydrolase
MKFRKLRADRLFDGYHLLDDKSVLIMSEEGEMEAIVPLSEAGDDVQTYTGILSPGLINCHCHLELSHMKEMIMEKTGLTEFVSQVILNRHLSEEKILTAIDTAETEMLDNGIVAVGDICNNTLTLPQKQKGRLWYHNFIEASGFLPQLADMRFERAVNIYKEYAKQDGFPAMSSSIVPHAPYSVSAELWDKIIHFPGNQLLTIHNQESVAEDEFFLYKKGDMLKLYDTMKMDISFFQPSGKRSLPSYYHRFLDNQQVIFVHNVHTIKDDLATADRSSGSERPFYWCLCPNANLYIGGQLPDVELLRQGNRTIVLGTDSLASNQQLSIVAEMQTLRQNFPSLEIEELFRWGTINGAKALQIDNILGSFEKGKKPGVVLSKGDLSESKRLM